jgi:glycosyltransferase involved in cell wall biosynthesis
MPVYNNENFIAQAIESILTQTLSDFELILINDGSTDRTGDIAQSFSDERIRYIKNEQNYGLVASLNMGLEMAKGDLIARMDGDDISMPNRFEEQYRFLISHQEIGAVGSAIQIIDADSRPIREWKFPSDPAMIRWTMIFTNPIAHPSVMMRKSLVQCVGGYRDFAAEDIDLWERLSQVSQLTNLPAVLIHLRKHSQNLYKIGSDILIASVAEINERIILQITHEVPPDGLTAKLYGKKIAHPGDISAIARLIDTLYRSYVSTPGLLPATQTNIRLDAARRLLRYIKIENIPLLQRWYLLWSALQLDPFVLVRVLTSQVSTNASLFAALIIS